MKGETWLFRDSDISELVDSIEVNHTVTAYRFLRGRLPYAVIGLRQDSGLEMVFDEVRDAGYCVFDVEAGSADLPTHHVPLPHDTGMSIFVAQKEDWGSL